jgi:saccharopine dehydrogenase (NAD+, L-lysine-forming)
VIIVYGATGYTGRLICELLVSRGVEMTIAGRSRSRLEDLERSLARIARGGVMPVIAEAPLEDPAKLCALTEKGKVVLDCAGPFAQLGPPMIEACLKTKTHYLDITGEVRFMVETARRDQEARAANVALVNAVGFDVVPSDFVAHLAAERLGGSVTSVEIGVAARRARPSGGTLRSLVGIIAESSMAYVDGDYVNEAVGSKSKAFPFPEEFGGVEAYSAPLGDLATAPRTTGAKRVRTYVAMKTMSALGAKLVSPIARALLRGRVKALAQNAMPATGEGPDPDDRMASRFAFIAEARKDTRISRAMIVGSDGYGMTAHTAVHAAIAMCSPAYSRYGALTPMQAIEPGIWRQLLEKIGCRITMLKLETV